MTEPDFDQRRRSFGSVADLYARFRPSYPQDAVTFAVGDAPRRILDLGAGTGLLTQRLVSLGHEVVAVEPDPQMLAVLVESLPVDALIGSAEAIPLPDDSVDAVTVGQAFHWFDQQRALPEIARVLRPGGVLGLLWNVLDDSVAWVDALCDITGGEARASLVEAEGDPELAPWFSQLEAASFGHTQELTLDELLGLVGSWSHIYLRDDANDVLGQVRSRVLQDPALKGFHEYSLPYLTSTFRATVC
jgi:SAM-dependent methyltransferase